MLHNYFSLVFISSNISTLKFIREEHSLFFQIHYMIIKLDYNPALYRYFSGNEEKDFSGFFDE